MAVRRLSFTCANQRKAAVLVCLLSTLAAVQSIRADDVIDNQAGSGGISTIIRVVDRPTSPKRHDRSGTLHRTVACSRVSRDRARCVLPKSSNEEHMLRHDFYTKHSHKQSGPKNAVPATNILMAEKRMRPVLRVCGGSNGRSSSRCCRR